jgi:hypothetical protein
LVVSPNGQQIVRGSGFSDYGMELNHRIAVTSFLIGSEPWVDAWLFE